MKKYSVEFSKKASKFLDQLAKKDQVIFRRVMAVILSLQEDPFQGKPLMNVLKGLYSSRVGSCRIVYSIQRKKVFVSVIKVGHRRDIYG